MGYLISTKIIQRLGFTVIIGYELREIWDELWVKRSYAEWLIHNKRSFLSFYNTPLANHLLPNFLKIFVRHEKELLQIPASLFL